MESDENYDPQQSPQLRRPTKIPHAPALARISEAESNAQALTTMPVNASLKHKPSGLPEPPTKRKTLAERAAEPFRSNPSAPPSSRPISNSVKAMATAGVRNPSSSSSSSRPFSTSILRNMSGTSFASSTSAGMRPASAHGSNRSGSAASHYRSVSQTSHTSGRPASSIDSRGPVDERPSAKRNGMVNLSRTPSYQDSIQSMGRQRRRNDVQENNIFTAWSSSAAAPTTFKNDPFNPFRDLSISSSMDKLSLRDRVNSKKETIQGPSEMTACPSTPSHIPKPVQQTPGPAVAKEVRKKASRKSLSPNKNNLTPGPFLSKDSNMTAAWDTKGRLDDMEKIYGNLKSEVESANFERSHIQEHLGLYKTRVNELELVRSQLTDANSEVKRELEDVKNKLYSMTVSLEDSRRAHTLDTDDLRRKHRNEIDDLRDEHRRENDRERRDKDGDLDRLKRENAETVAHLEQKLRAEVEEERSRRTREVQEVQNQWALHKQNVELDAGTKDRETQTIRSELAQVRSELEQEKILGGGLKTRLSEECSRYAILESEAEAMKAKIKFLESDSQQQSQSFADLNARTQEAIEAAAEANAKLRVEETLRRKLHNQVQELKGNIRVFCRVRPCLETETDDIAKIAYPDVEQDSKELNVIGPESKNAMGKDTTSKNGFSFDRVFGPSSQNTQVFDEISQLIQSALDGYNVCIFCYGQTGSGKTHTMSAEDGMIPLAVHQIYDTAHGLEDKGWKYTMEGSFVEVYNENLNDLLGKADDIDKKKLDIRHDMQKGRTTITDVTTVRLDNPSTVANLLGRASSNRSVAATKANERSSRSHSVFILRLCGENSITGERSEGTLNLVDLAGSERLTHSGATGDRLKETQNINRSLSCLGDVISALGQGKEGGHIPYRNSKLTYLLQNSLGGNSKTLMFVMVSPLIAHLNETLSSLKFATKVHNTHIGTAKKMTKVRDV